MKTYSGILREVGDAVDYVREQGGFVPDNTMERQNADGAMFAGLPDEQIIEGYYPETVGTLPPNVVSVRTIPEFRMVYDALAQVHNNMRLPSSTIDDHVEHETSHKRVGEGAFRMRNSVFALIITKSHLVPDPNNDNRLAYTYTCRPSTHFAGPTTCKITKLASAAITAAPFKLSDGDTARIRAMGYAGPHDIAHRIRSASVAELRGLPIPESSR